MELEDLSQHYIDVYEAALAINETSPGYYSDEHIDNLRIHASRQQLKV